MRMKRVHFFALEVVDRDELNNPIYEPVPIGSYKGILTQWSLEEIAVMDREVLETHQKLLTDAPRSVLERAERVEIEGVSYAITDLKKDFRRWRLCHVKADEP